MDCPRGYLPEIESRGSNLLHHSSVGGVQPLNGIAQRMCVLCQCCQLLTSVKAIDKVTRKALDIEYSSSVETLDSSCIPCQCGSGYCFV